MEESLNQLKENPADWSLRCSIVEQFYHDGQYAEAFEIMTAAPEIPGDEANVLFTATVLGAHDALLVVGTRSRALLEGAHPVGHGAGIGVPIAAAVVMQTPDVDSGFIARIHLLGDPLGSQESHNQNRQSGTLPP